MRIAQIAPLWESVPPALYGGTERVVHYLSEELLRRGHQVVLFASGEPVSARLIDETERLLRANRYVYDVQIRPLAVHDGVVDVEVLTRDTWSIDPGVSFGRAGGANRASVRLREYNLLEIGRAHV